MNKKQVKPKCCATGVQFAVVVARFNQNITDKLLKACLDEFARLGVCECQVQVVPVPGAFELPVTALKLALKKKIKAVICLGAVIKGQTFHYELVAQEAARGIMDVALKTGKPVVFEVLAADTVGLCLARAKDGDHDNKGASAARAAFDMANTLDNCSYA
ncbi:MAG: 6,7-dimethyl-8-ribityllumazine synthase [Candidatus Omnitrophica bacterium]|nr:6,7-dimethyl-8-ribityllumazine synthase [Candidatus Omnitrophota bacterium]